MADHGASTYAAGYKSRRCSCPRLSGSSSVVSAVSTDRPSMAIKVGLIRATYNTKALVPRVSASSGVLATSRQRVDERAPRELVTDKRARALNRVAPF